MVVYNLYRKCAIIINYYVVRILMRF